MGRATTKRETKRMENGRRRCIYSQIFIRETVYVSSDTFYLVILSLSLFRSLIILVVSQR